MVELQVAGRVPGRSATLLIAVALIFGVSLLGSLVYWQQAEGVRAAGKAGGVDIGFAQFMSVHHEQAIAMARILQQSNPEALGGLAPLIIDKQERELQQMQGWLQSWQQDVHPPTSKMTWMLAGDAPPDEALRQYLLDCERSPTGMPGLATAGEMAQLQALQGEEQQRWFLELMLAHHRGGIPMAKFAAANGRVASLRHLAAHIVEDQVAELETMENLLRTLNTGSAG